MIDRLRDLASSLGRRLRGFRLADLRTALPVLLPLLVGLLVGLWLALPAQPLIQRALRTAQSDHLRLEVGDTSMGLTGIRLSDVEVTAPLRVHFDTVVVRPRLAMLWFNPGVSLRAERGDGSVRGTLGMGADRDVSLLFENFDIAEAGLGKGLPWGLTLAGRLSGQVDLILPGGQPFEMTGTVDLAVVDGLLTLPEGLLPQPSIRLGDVTARLQAAAGVIEIERVAVDGSDLSGSLRGKVELRRPVARSLVDASLKLRFEEPLRSSLATLLPLAGFRTEREAFVRDMRGTLGTFIGGGG